MPLRCSPSRQAYFPFMLFVSIIEMIFTKILSKNLYILLYPSICTSFHHFGANKFFAQFVREIFANELSQTRLKKYKGRLHIEI